MIEISGSRSQRAHRERDAAPVAARLNRLWYGGHPAVRLLKPLDAAMVLAIRLRRFLYANDWLAREGVDAFVVIVGNLSAGGTGKTPVVGWLTEALIERGLKPGIVCSGYGGTSTEAGLVTPDSPAAVVGDEAALLARLCDAPVAAGRDRVAAARLLLDNADVSVLVCDDGLQHLRLKRDFEIVVIDGARWFGNGMCLPFGPLREPESRLGTVDAVIVNGGARRIDAAAYCSLEATGVRELRTGKRAGLEAFSGAAVHAVAAIGNPDRFFSTLRRAGLEVIGHAHRDHATLAPDALHFGDGLPVLITEKDAVKCRDDVAPNVWAVETKLRFETDAGRLLVGRIVDAMEGRDD